MTSTLNVFAFDQKIKELGNMFERTPPVYPHISFSDESGIDTVF